ncbi:MAG TPA: hypothetical protein VJM46_02585 [Candidatus Saccharimonadales bacterium]|nr:hypothetical protein [Candidatus Saccharimonadales bacterium]
MGPFSNNNSSPPPSTPTGGNKLPIPDVNGEPQPVVVSTEPDNSLATKKWFITTLIIAGIMATAGLITFVIYIFVSNTPGYMLNAAMQNIVTSHGEAGVISYEVKQDKTVHKLQGTFISYTDPSNPSANTTTLSLGQGGAQVSGTLRLLENANYFQTAGLGNVGRLVESMQGDASAYTQDKLVRLASLDGQWYTFTSDDVYDSRMVLPRQVQGGLTAKDTETIGQLYLKHSFMTSVTQLGDEQVNSINTMHLKVSFDQTKLEAFLRDLKAANIKALSISDDDINALKAGQPLGLDKATIEVWINRSDRRFQQLRITRPQTDVAQDSLTITFKSEQVAAQRQTVVRPEGAKAATVLLRGIHDILATPAAQ